MLGPEPVGNAKRLRDTPIELFCRQRGHSSAGESIPPSLDYLLFNFAAYTIAFAYLLVRRYRLATAELALELAGPEGEA